ncbi:transmembrane 220 family protein [Pontibacter sp. E15-1]|uniref:transmembrane 220 family protein n=1 Tax=Pontibacter sp. E15-1 TaxID=2919918 RepID=UPI001F503D66|nr:transmembrane 220 family protein [Pontibacter sp. E15-1]MCJ8166719.1 transmembrane 220 family protein [Pontibacter sp. E15-1]
MLLKKIVGIFFGVLFLTFVVMQYNDPDPAIWMTIYGIAAALNFMAAFRTPRQSIFLLAAAVYIAGGIYMWPARFEGVSIGAGDINNIEEARESLGLFLCSLSFMVYIVLAKVTKHPSEKAL